MDGSFVEKLLWETSTHGEEYTSNGRAEHSRRELLASARKLVAALESPAEVLGRMNWLEVSAIYFLCPATSADYLG